MAGAGARRADARQACACGRSAGQGAAISGRRSTGAGSISARHTGYGRGSSNAVLTDPADRHDQQPFQRRDRRRAGRLQCPAAVRPAARRRSRSHLSELSDLELSRLLARDRALRMSRAMGLCRHRARPHRLRQRAVAGLRHRRSGLGRRTLSQYARRSATTKSTSTSGSAGPPAPAWNMPSRRTGACGSNISTASSNAPTSAFPSGAQYNSTLDFQSLRIGLNRKVDWPGSTKLDAEDRSDRSRIRPLGNPRPDHLSAAGLSGIPRALYRPEQPDAGAAGAGDLEQQPVSERPALGGRRGLLQSRTAAGIRLERHRRRRRLSQRRSAEVQLPLPALQHLAAVPAPDLRLRRRAGRAGQRPAAARRARSTSPG